MAGTARGRRLGNLAAETTSFVGRHAELARLSGLIGEHRLVTLTGVGGVGKSRLALRAADAAHAAYPDGVWVVELSPLRDPALLALEIVDVLRLADKTTRPAVEVLVEWLTGKRLLLVLDSCEHLAHACARLADTLLEAAHGLHILATSRRPLGTVAEHRMAVDPLPVESGEAVTLFEERAGAAAPGRTLASDGAGDSAGDGIADGEKTVAGICHRLDGIPLAIELAAAQLSELTLEELGDRLTERFELLATEDTSGPLRHQTLRTTIGWSHELCAPLERLLWARLSVFAGGFDLAAAEAVCAGGPLAADSVAQVLDGLVEKSIVRREERTSRQEHTRGHTQGEQAPVRYRMLDTVREYGGQWLRELGEEHATRRGHRDFYLALARRGDAEWMGPEQEAWYARTVAEHANLRAALDFCLTEPDGGTALEMAGALWFFWFACGFQREGRRYLERALAGDPRPGPARTRALWACAASALGQGDSETGLKLGSACLSAAREQDDPDEVLAATYILVGGLSIMDEPARAAEIFDDAPQPAGRRTGHVEAARLIMRVARAFAHLQLGEFARAAAVADGVRKECAETGEQWVHAYGHWMRALADLGLGEIASAAEHTRAALVDKRHLHDTTGIAMAIDLLASTVVAGGDGERAARLLGIAERIWLTLGLPQLGSQELVAVREECERRTRDAIGDAAYESAFAAGLGTEQEEGIAYALRGTRADG